MEDKLRIFIMIDVSDSMFSKMDFINSAMKDIIFILKNMDKKFDIKISVMTFSTDIEWQTNGIINIENYEWNNLKAGGSCNLVKALNEFRKANILNIENIENIENERIYPIIILISNGKIVNSNGRITNELKNEFEIFNHDKMLRETIKVSIALGNGIFRNILQEFATMNTILIPHSINMFKRIIKYAVIPRGFNIECYADEDRGYQYSPWMVWNDHFFQENYNLGHEHIYSWNKIFYNDIEDIIKPDDIDIYRKRYDNFEIWWEEQKYNPILDECIVYKTNIEKIYKEASADEAW